MRKVSYSQIDMEKTGRLLEYRIKQAGYKVSEIPEILMLSCPQPVYRWFKGKTLPSLDHLRVLSQLLDVHMEDLLVSQCEQTKAVAKPEKKGLLKEMLRRYYLVKICKADYEVDYAERNNMEKRLLAYARALTSTALD